MPARWTPDFTKGDTELAMEAGIRRLHLGHRTTSVVAAALRLVADAGQARHPTRAWAAWSLDALSVAAMHRRTTTWHSLRQPGVVAVDSALGAASLFLGSGSTAVDDQVNGSAWTNRVLLQHVSAPGLAGRRGAALAGATAAPILAVFLGAGRNAGRRVLLSNAIPLVDAVASGVLVSESARREARAADDRARHWAEDGAAAAIEAERTAFVHEVLAPAPAVLDSVAALWADDRPAALRAAATEETRVRAWLGSGPVDRPAAHRPERLAEVDRGVRRIQRRIEATNRLTIVAKDLVWLGRHPDRGRTWHMAMTSGIVLRGIAGGLLIVDPLHDRYEAPTRRFVAAVDVATVSLAAGFERSGGDVVGWSERHAWAVSTLIGHATTWRRAEGAATLGAMIAVRAAAAVLHPDRRNRSRRRRAAAATSEALMISATAFNTYRAARSILELAEAATLSKLDPVHHRPEVEAIRVRHRGFVHDGLAQVLGAIRQTETGSLYTDRELRTWIDEERRRIDAMLGVTTGGHAGDLAAGLASLAEEYTNRGMFLLTESSDLPGWADDVGGTALAIIREGLNNVLKHGEAESAWCGILHQDDDTILVRLTDHGTEHPVFVPGSGTGTSTMIGLAGQIGADIEWFKTRAGGTEVRLVLHPPS